MRRPLIVLATLLSLLSPSAQAANSTVSAMTAASALGGTELLYCVQSAADRKCTPAQLSAYIFGLVSGDLTCTGLGACTLKNTGPGAIGPLGSTTTTPVVTIDAQGRVTALTSASIAFPAAPAGANPTATAGPTAVNGVATTFLRSDGAPAIQKASNAQFGIMEGDGTTVTCTAGVCSAPPAVTSRTVTGTTDTILAGDLGNVVYYNSASAVAVTQPAPSGSFVAGFFTTICNINAGVATITPASGTIGGAGTKAIPAGSASQPVCLTYQSDGTNFNLIPGYIVDAALLTTGTVNAARLPFGTGVGTAAANNLSAAGGLSTTVASGTSALGTGAITSATCATVVTTTATNVATTDTLSGSFNSDPTGVTGYAASASGMLTIIGYPTSGNVNWKVCNNTSGSITPGAITLNWRVVR